MPIRDLNLGVWFYVFEYLTPSELLNFGLTCKLACVFHARQRTFQGSPVHSSSRCRLDSISVIEICLIISDRFLPAGAAKDRVALVSYPRCGNSFLRSVLEERTRIVTGSDSAPLRSLSAELLKCGYAVSYCLAISSLSI